MADFKPKVLQIILDNEGGYVNDPDDTGGETWAGVARNKNPHWRGWAIVDALKAANPSATSSAKKGIYKPINSVLRSSSELADMVADLYEDAYWNINRLGELKDQQLATNVADCGVNCGTGTAAIMLQKAYNNRGVSGTKLVVDGAIGAKSIAAINGANAESIYNAYNDLRRAYYLGMIAKNPVNVKYKSAWLSRIVDYVA